MSCQVPYTGVAWAAGATVGIIFKEVLSTIRLRYLCLICIDKEIKDIVVLQFGSATLVINDLRLDYQLS